MGFKRNMNLCGTKKNLGYDKIQYYNKILNSISKLYKAYIAQNLVKPTLKENRKNAKCNVVACYFITKQRHSHDIHDSTYSGSAL